MILLMLCAVRSRCRCPTTGASCIEGKCQGERKYLSQWFCRLNDLIIKC